MGLNSVFLFVFLRENDKTTHVFTRAPLAMPSASIYSVRRIDV